MTGRRHQVVVIGGGFGGLHVTKGLADADVDVTILDRTNHHLFQPLLYEVATGILSEGMIAPAFRSIVKKQANARPLLAEVRGIDLDERVVHAETPAGDDLRVPYDTLVVAAGAAHAYFGHDEWSAYAPGMKTLEDARRLRSHILGAFEMAELAEDPVEQEAWLTFVVIGAGPTVLTPFHPKLQRYTQRRLEKMGVQVRTGLAAADMDDESITVTGAGGRERIAARTKIWAAGVQASPLARMLAQATGAELDRAGRVSVGPDCSLPGHPEVFAIGDMVSLNGLPGVAQPAMQEGDYVAHVIGARVAGRRAPKPFTYFDKGNMATIGRGRAIADAFGVRMTGPLAFAAWAFIHVLYLIGWGHRIGTLYHWAWSLLLTKNRGQRLITVTQAHDEVTHEKPAVPAPDRPTLAV